MSTAISRSSPTAHERRHTRHGKSRIEEVTISTGGESVTMTGEQFDRAVETIVGSEEDAEQDEFEGVDAPELPSGVVVLGKAELELANSFFARQDEAAEFAKQMKDKQEAAKSVLANLVGRAGADARRILFKGSELALNIRRATTVKAKRDQRSQHERSK
jgi:hypothetical protein